MPLSCKPKTFRNSNASEANRNTSSPSTVNQPIKMKRSKSSQRTPGRMELHQEVATRFVDDANQLVGMASLVSDLLAANVWHIGLFMVATARHGNGDAQSLYRDLEEWVVRSGAEWLRLGVVEGNSRAERFWLRAGFVEVRKRGPLEMGTRVNTIRVMAKPLAGGALTQYLALVTRDQPES